MTATLSSELLHAIEIDVVVVLTTVRFGGVVGAVVSAGGGHAMVDAVAVLFADRLPAASNALTSSA